MNFMQQLNNIKKELDAIEYPPELDKLELNKPYDTNVIIQRLIDLNRFKGNDYAKFLQIISQLSESGKFEFCNNWKTIKRIK